MVLTAGSTQVYRYEQQENRFPALLESLQHLKPRFRSGLSWFGALRSRVGSAEAGNLFCPPSRTHSSKDPPGVRIIQSSLQSLSSRVFALLRYASSATLTPSPNRGIGSAHQHIPGEHPQSWRTRTRGLPGFQPEQPPESSVRGHQAYFAAFLAAFLTTFLAAFFATFLTAFLAAFFAIGMSDSPPSLACVS
jgi:hypothetical protein